jgi:hypothetical protein
MEAPLAWLFGATSVVASPFVAAAECFSRFGIRPSAPESFHFRDWPIHVRRIDNGSPVRRTHGTLLLGFCSVSCGPEAVGRNLVAAALPIEPFTRNTSA